MCTAQNINSNNKTITISNSSSSTTIYTSNNKKKKKSEWKEMQMHVAQKEIKWAKAVAIVYIAYIHTSFYLTFYSHHEERHNKVDSVYIFQKKRKISNRFRSIYFFSSSCMNVVSVFYFCSFFLQLKLCVPQLKSRKIIIVFLFTWPFLLLLLFHLNSKREWKKRKRKNKDQKYKRTFFSHEMGPDSQLNDFQMKAFL